MFSYFKEYFDFRAFLICVALVVIGLISIYSATFDINNAANFHRQALWAGIGFIIMVFTSFVPLRTLQRLSISFYFIVLAILVIILVIGSTIKGSKSWF
jgi:cell division protein FtsW (lipid II flippase)